MDGVSTPTHLPRHLPSLRYALEERQRKMPLVRRKIELHAIQLKNPLPLSGQQLAIRVWRDIPEHEVRLLVGFSVKIFKGSRSQDAPRGALIPTINKRVSSRGAPLAEQRSLPLEL